MDTMYLESESRPSEAYQDRILALSMARRAAKLAARQQAKAKPAKFILTGEEEIVEFQPLNAETVIVTVIRADSVNKHGLAIDHARAEYARLLKSGYRRR